MFGDYGPYIFTVPTLTNDGYVGTAQVLVSRRLVRYLLPHIQSLLDSERREVRVSASWETAHDGTDQPSADWEHRARYEAYVLDAVVRDAVANKLSVISISPTRFEGAPYAPRGAGVGDVVAEYIGAKMAEWKEDHHG